MAARTTTQQQRMTDGAGDEKKRLRQRREGDVADGWRGRIKVKMVMLVTIEKGQGKRC